jgi:7,8-dihydropterin-6-yl-methyl-4-(beta-D-ribofuranosyl)aminobenzene 5'-phosphate synthase
MSGPLLVSLFAASAAASPASRVTILYDAFGESALEKDWGFSALIEFRGMRILFDTGNDAPIFARNAKAANVDLTRLDFAVVSHRHLDHAAGLRHLLDVNPGVTIYVPKEPLGGPFGSTAPPGFYRREPASAERARYFGGRGPAPVVLGSAWPGAKFLPIDETREIAPGVFLVSTMADGPGVRELRELSLVLRTPEGLAVIVGCSHPGIERILDAARRIDPRIRFLIGGFHLPAASDQEIARIGGVLHDALKVEWLAPGHCTGEPAFARFEKLWGRRYVYAGVGSVIPLP